MTNTTKPMTAAEAMSDAINVGMAFNDATRGIAHLRALGFRVVRAVPDEETIDAAIKAYIAALDIGEIRVWPDSWPEHNVKMMQRGCRAAFDVFLGEK